MADDLIKNDSNLTQIQVAILSYIMQNPPAKHEEIAMATGQTKDVVAILMSDSAFKKVYQNAVLSSSHNRFQEVVSMITDQAADGKLGQQKLFLQIHEVLFDQSQRNKTPEVPQTADPELLTKKTKKIEAEILDLLKEEQEGGVKKERVIFEEDQSTELKFGDKNV